MPEWLRWLLSPNMGQDKLTLLFLCLPTAHVLSTNLLYRVERVRPWEWLCRVERSWAWRWLAQLVRAAYYVGVPLAVFWRGTSVWQVGLPDTYGASLPVGVMDLALTVALGMGALGLSVAIWVWYINAVPRVEEEKPLPWWEALREAGFAQSLWALYRGILRMMPMDSIYASFASLIVVTITYVLDPRRRGELPTPRGHLVVQEWMHALFTACLSPIVHFWILLIPFHSLWLGVGSRTRVHLLATARRVRVVRPDASVGGPTHC